MSYFVKWDLGVTLAAFGSSANANGLTYSGGALNLEPASASFPGGITSAQFTKLSNLSGTNSGDVTLDAVGASANANGASLSGQVFTLQPSSASFPGLMTAAQFTTLSNQSGTNTGDVTLAAFGSAPSANAASLSGQALTLQPADATHPGGIALADQQLGTGVKGVDALKLGTTTPSTPAAGLTLFATQLAHPLASYVDPSGVVCRLAPFVLNTHYILARGESALIDAHGATSDQGGTAGAVSWANTNTLTKTFRMTLTSSASAGSSCKARFTSPAVYRESGYFIAFRAGFSTQTATFRWFLGLTGNFANLNPSDSINTNIIGVGQDVGDTLVYFMTNDGSGTATKTSTGLSTPGTGDLLDVTLYAPPGGSSVVTTYAVNRGTPVSNTASSDLPVATTARNPQAWCNNGSTASACVMDFVYAFYDALT